MRPIYLGNDKWKNHPIEWNPITAMNPHLIVAGQSGSGKTYTLTQIAKELALSGAKIHVFDVHGDLEFGRAICSTVKFSETSPYGINPLKISPDPDYGGVRKRIRNFIAMLNRTSRKLGPKQENVLTNLLRDLFSANGFYEDDPKTWTLEYDPRRRSRFAKKNPTLQDLEKFANYKLKQLLTGASSKAYAAIAEIAKIHSRIKTAVNKGDEAKIDELKQKYLAACREFVDNLGNGQEIDEFIKYDSKDTLQSTYYRIENLVGAGIFKNEPPRFDHNRPIWRYDISALSVDEQRMMIEILSEEIFLSLRERGIVAAPDHFIFIDEAKHFISDEPDHIINVLFSDARKFGLGVVLASQSITHFTEDILQSAATKLILGIDDTFHDKASRMLKIEAKRLKYIRPRETALVQIRDTAGKSAAYQDMVIGF